MTKQEILTELYLSKAFNECIGRMEPRHLQDDLRAEVMLVLCEMNPEDITGMWERNELMYYTFRIVCNMIKSDRSTFAKTYRRQWLEVEERGEEVCVDDITSDVDLCPSVKCVLNGRVMKEAREDRLVEIVNGLYWYDAAVLRLYAEQGSFRKMEKVTGIPWESFYKTTKKAIKKIKEHVKL